jgi:hypothetical protein
MPLATYLKKAATAFPAARSNNNTNAMIAQQRPISVPSVQEARFDDPDVIRISQWDAFLFTVSPASQPSSRAFSYKHNYMHRKLRASPNKHNSDIVLLTQGARLENTIRTAESTPIWSTFLNSCT